MKAKLQEKADALIKEIRQYSESQKELWQKLPYLALQAEGRGEQKGEFVFGHIYYRGYKNLSCTWGEYSHYASIDLETGIIVKTGNIILNHYRYEPADNGLVGKLAGHIDEIDASAALRHFEELASQPYDKSICIVGIDKIEEKKNAIIQELNLKKIYVRKK